MAFDAETLRVGGRDKTEATGSQPPLSSERNPVAATSPTNELPHREDGAFLWSVVFPSSSSLNGHPGRPGKRATGGGARPGARGPGRGPTVVWAQPGCWGFLSPKLQSEELAFSN